MGNASGALGGAISGAEAGSAFGPWGTAIGGVVGGVAGFFGGGSGGNKAPTYQPLDISKIISDARTNAADNYKNSFDLEKQYNPDQAALRTTANIGLNNLASGNTAGFSARNSILTGINSPHVDTSVSSNPLLAESSDRILSNLRLGGHLGADAQAQAVQAALEKGGAAGISGSGAGRGLVARDLGLTSMGVENQRIGAAQSAGQTQAQLALQGQQLGLQDYLGRLSGASGAAGLDASTTGLLAGIVDGRPLPSAGLDPGAIASLYVADNNARNQVGTNNAAINQQQRNQNLNSLLGLGSTAASSGGIGALAGLLKGFGKGGTGGDTGGGGDFFG